MNARSPAEPVSLDALINDGARLAGALRPFWREVSRTLPRGQGRKYFPFAIGLIAVVIAGIYIASAPRMRQKADAARGGGAAV